MPQLIESRTNDGELVRPARITLDERDKFQMPTDKFLGVVSRESVSDHDLPPWKSFEHMWEVIWGGTLSEFFNPMRVSAQEAMTSATVVNFLLNSLEKRLVQGYQAANFHPEAISYVRTGGATSFRDQQAIRLKYLGDLSTVDPESADYQEMTAPGDEKATYSLVQKGNLLTITRKTMINDDGGLIVGQLADRFGRSAARTFAKAAFAPIVNNVTYAPDGIALAHASHNNLGSTVLSADATGAAAVLTGLGAMAAQTEPGSGETLPLNIAETDLWLIVPKSLLDKAITLNALPTLATYHLFGDRHERILYLPWLPDQTDWYLSRGDVPTVEVSFLNDQRLPEISRAETPTLPMQLLSERLQFRVRYEYAIGAVDFRGLFKSVVAG